MNSPVGERIYTITRIAAGALLCAMLPVSCATDQADATSRAPMAGSTSTQMDVLKASNRNLRRVVLDNGMICLVKEDHSAPVVSVQIWIGTGSIHEDEYLGGGLAHYVEHMIFKGTETRAATRITKDIDEAGGSINAYTSTDRTVIYALLPSKNWRVGIDVLSDAVMNSVFPEEEWEREKDREDETPDSTTT